MKFKHGTRRRAAEYEKDWVQRWKEDDTFNKSIAQRPADNSWVFYDGPPFLTGTPHHGHLLVSTVKDTMGRFHTMKGQRVERRWGWDCHGLPAEVYVEKTLGARRLAFRITSRNVERLWFELAPNGKTRLSELVVGSSLRALIKPWIIITWNLFGGRSRDFTKKAKSTKAKRF